MQLDTSAIPMNIMAILPIKSSFVLIKNTFLAATAVKKD
jgi:hypothetical protein